MKTISALALLVTTAAAVGCAASSTPRSSAEATAACAKIDDKAVQAFYEPGQVYAAEPLYERGRIRTKVSDSRELVGAELYLHAPQGTTTEYLQRALSCHATRNVASHANDPMHPRGKIDAVGVRSNGASFVIALSSRDPDTAKDILDRSRAFATDATSVDVRQVSQLEGPRQAN